MKTVYVLLISALLLSACSKDDDGGSATLTFSGINSATKSSNSLLENDVIITDFKLSIRDVEFKKDESELDSNEVQFRGPYDIDLASETEAISQTIGTVDIPDGNYKVVRFKLHKSRERFETDLLYDRSLYMEGTINGTPFEFWHDASENLDVENIGGIIVAGNNVAIDVQFHLNQFLNSLHNIDLTQANDENQDGLIQINPDDDDGNGDIADLLKENIKEAADLIKL